MNISKVTAVFFSPAGGTKKVVRAFVSALPYLAEDLDLTPFAKRLESRSFGGDELVVFAVPVYAGRIAPLAAERLVHMRGSRTPVVCLAVYGNRAYEDALLELTALARQKGFVPFAAAAAVTQHSIMGRVAAGRPDGQDKENLSFFARRVSTKLAEAQNPQDLTVPCVPGSFPYKPYKAVGFVPFALSSCIRCGRCAALCPAGAISLADPRQTDAARCTFCMGCVRICPVGAREVDKEKLHSAEAIFVQKFGARRELEFFL